MNHKNFIKLIITISIFICGALAVYHYIPEQFLNFPANSQKTISFVIIVLILLSVLYSVLSKNNLKKFASQLLIWVLILLSVIIGYAFRFELNYSAQRVMAVLVPSYHWVNKDGELVIARSSDGHFYIDALVNDVKIKFMVDTGASDVALTKADAQKLKFDLSKLQFTKTYSTANGSSAAAPVKLNTIIIGGIFKNIEAHIGRGDLDISLLGMSMLERFKGFRIDRDMLILSY